MVGEGGKQAFTNTLLIIHADKSFIFVLTWLQSIKSLRRQKVK